MKRKKAIFFCFVWFWSWVCVCVCVCVCACVNVCVSELVSKRLVGKKPHKILSFAFVQFWLHKAGFLYCWSWSILAKFCLMQIKWVIYYLKSVVLDEGWFLCRGYLTGSWDNFGCETACREQLGLWIVAKNTAEHPTMYKTVSQERIIWPKISIAPNWTNSLKSLA